MSPVEAKKYGLIDHVVGGDEKTFQLDSSMYGTIGGAERYFKAPDITRTKDEQKEAVKE